MAPGNLGPRYRLTARGRQQAEDDRLSLLEQIFDPISRRYRELVQPGWRCLEVGAGRGSMAVWLAERVGKSGQVVATDIDVTYLKRLNLPNLEVCEHDILNDPLDALAPGSFDLVCLRWSARGYDPTLGRKLPMLFEQCGWETSTTRQLKNSETALFGAAWGRNAQGES